MIDSDWLVMGALLALFCGIAIGQWAEAWRWRDKAKGEIRFRKESGGKLYNVLHSDEYDALMQRVSSLVEPPATCPITGREFFMTIDGKPTYGGPYDSYTIPERDADGYLHCERYDHDEGQWIEGGASLGLMIVDPAEAP
jgi:hypothetical protein